MNPQRASVLRVWWAALALVCVIACAPESKPVPATQLIVRVSAEALLRSGLESLRVRTAAPNAGRWAQRLEKTYPATGLNWPVDLVLVPKEESAADDTFEIIVEALGARGAIMAQSRVLTSYVLRDARILPIQLATCGGAPGGLCEGNAACFGPDCRTCLMSGCASTPLVEAADLPRAPTQVASALDAGPDAEAQVNVDPQTRDARAEVDARPAVEAGAVADATGCGAASPCVNLCDNACDPLASCSVSGGRAVCSCPAPYSSSDGGKTCIKTSTDAGGVVDAGITPVDGGGAVDAGSKLLPRVTNTDVAGPFVGVVKVMNTPPGGWLVYPTEIGKDGVKHPLFVFAPGGGTTPQQYTDHLDRFASYGIVTYALSSSSGDGAPMKAGLDWLIEQNNVTSSPLYQKLDVTKVCAGGHSQGSIVTFAFMPDARVTTTIHISGGSFDGMGPSKLRGDALFLAGPNDADVAAQQSDIDFQNSTVPTFYTKIQGAAHLTSARLGLPAISAWMLWHLAGQEDPWKKEFLQAGGKFQSGIFVSQSKNWR